MDTAEFSREKETVRRAETLVGMSVSELLEVKKQLDVLGLGLGDLKEFLDRDKAQLFSELKFKIRCLEKKLENVRKASAEHQRQWETVMKVTKEDVEKAKSEWQAAYNAADDAAHAAYAAADDAAEAATKPAWDKYRKLQWEYDNESN